MYVVTFLSILFSSNIYKHLENNNILCNNQSGFRNGHSCEIQLLTTVDELLKNLNLGLQTDVLSLDFKKAFDKVLHLQVITLWIHNATLNWIQNFLINRTQQVIVNGYSSSPSNVISGIPQGIVLGPLLFLCYINGLPSNVRSSVKLYADDVVLYRAIHSAAGHDILQQDLNSLI